MRPSTAAACTLDIVAADHVEDHVGALATREFLDLLHEILPAIVDGEIGAERAAAVAFRRPAGGRDHRRAEGLGELDQETLIPDVPPWIGNTSPGFNSRPVEHVLTTL